MLNRVVLASIVLLSNLAAIAEANAKAIRQVAEAIEAPGGMQSVNFKIAEQYVAAFGNLAIKSNTMILPTNAADVAGMIATAMSVIRQPGPPKAGG